MTSIVNATIVQRRLWPFASAALFGVLLALVPGAHTDALELGIGVGITLSVLVAAVAARWRSLPPWSPVVAAFDICWPLRCCGMQRAALRPASAR